MLNMGKNALSLNRPTKLDFRLNFYTDQSKYWYLHFICQVTIWKFLCKIRVVKLVIWDHIQRICTSTQLNVFERKVSIDKWQYQTISFHPNSLTVWIIGPLRIRVLSSGIHCSNKHFSILQRASVYLQNVLRD